MESFKDLPLFRNTDPETSVEGATHARRKQGGQTRQLLDVYRNHAIFGLTDEQACQLAGLEVGGWKRCSDLRRLGWIEPTGETRTGVAGVNQRVCRITPLGIEAQQ